MDSSPKGREIEKLVGNSDAIISRGNQITSLGDQMINSAATLKEIADGATGQKGLAVTKLKDVVGDCYKELKLAGERYKPTGPAFVAYGNTLADVQPKISSIVKDCEDDWATYTTKSGAVPTDSTSGTSPSDDGSSQKTAAEELEAAQGEKDTAYQTWKDDAIIFDTHYDTWEEAFDKAVDDIGEATDGGISDGFWDDVDGFVASALEVLKWVGLGLALACIIIGGPILAAVAAVVAIATLALTIYSFCRGHSTVTDLVFAGIGVIPFGSVGKLFNGGKLEFLQDVVGGLGSGKFTDELASMVGGFRSGSSGIQGLSGVFAGLKGSGSVFAHFDGLGAGNIISRLFTGKNMADMGGEVNNAGDAINILGSVWGDGFTKNLFGIPDTLGDFHNKIGQPA